MNTIAPQSTSSGQVATHIPQPESRIAQPEPRIPHLASRIPHRASLALAIVLALCNLPMLSGSIWMDGVFYPQAIAAGEWWRVLTHAFVHVSPYHLFIDGIAVFFLLRELARQSGRHRALLFGASLAGSLLASIWFAPAIAERGLCGLSGIAHGLMAATCLLGCLDRFRPKVDRHIYLCLLIATASKVLIECVTGSAFFSASHLGNVGTPVVVCHAGGFLGGLMASIALTSARKTKEGSYSGLADCPPNTCQK